MKSLFCTFLWLLMAGCQQTETNEQHFWCWIEDTNDIGPCKPEQVNAMEIWRGNKGPILQMWNTHHFTAIEAHFHVYDRDGFIIKE